MGDAFSDLTNALAGLANAAQRAELVKAGIDHVAKIVGGMAAVALLGAAKAALDHGATEDDFVKVARLAYVGLKGRR